MSDNICRYCGRSKFVDGACVSCGASEKDSQSSASQWERCEPFSYNGFVIWTLADYSRDLFRYQFWLGHDLIGEVPISRDLINDMQSQYGDFVDFTPIIWSLFLLMSGDEKEYILKVSERNKQIKPAKFRITLIREDDDQFQCGIRRADFEIAKAMAYQ